ncbi:MAG: hypothetical protein QXG69_05360 [Candidatus Caldarchaeum sp.]|uniref:Uncharacterized protein n=1 Tax=Caldiarchaeum subterraneum TaxID=311458 RepID=A0A7C5Q6E8_CALS0
MVDRFGVNTGRRMFFTHLHDSTQIRETFEHFSTFNPTSCGKTGLTNEPTTQFRADFHQIPPVFPQCKSKMKRWMDDFHQSENQSRDAARKSSETSAKCDRGLYRYLKRLLRDLLATRLEHSRRLHRR